ncbi:group II intron maturase-specific domain-containing protein [Clostridium algidicarnis]|uniref:group II intron maturase-specific domain-containing protein n=1 Tax=Clostridium algidicarnis TaxID=37659 RepID=UPI001C0DE464|nr:hypothetical protein [Clostridium algidicarnis]
MKTRIKELTAKGNALGYKNLKKKLKEYVTEWVNYFKLADIKGILTNTDLWLRRRIWIVTLLLKMEDKPKHRVPCKYRQRGTDRALHQFHTKK